MSFSLSLILLTENSPKKKNYKSKNLWPKILFWSVFLIQSRCLRLHKIWHCGVLIPVTHTSNGIVNDLVSYLLQVIDKNWLPSLDTRFPRRNLSLNWFECLGTYLLFTSSLRSRSLPRCLLSSCSYGSVKLHVSWQKSCLPWPWWSVDVRFLTFT